MYENQTAKQIIAALGGTAETARYFDVTPSAVSQWRVNGIPKLHMRCLACERPELLKSLPEPLQ